MRTTFRIGLPKSDINKFAWTVNLSDMYNALMVNPIVVPENYEMWKSVYFKWQVNATKLWVEIVPTATSLPAGKVYDYPYTALGPRDTVVAPYYEPGCREQWMKGGLRERVVLKRYYSLQKVIGNKLDPDKYQKNFGQNIAADVLKAYWNMEFATADNAEHYATFSFDLFFRVTFYVVLFDRKEVDQRDDPPGPEWGRNWELDPGYPTEAGISNYQAVYVPP